MAAISKKLVRLMENDLVLGKSVGTDNLENETVKSGGAVKVRRQMQYLGQDNNLDLSAFSEDVTEGTVTVTLDQTWSNKVSISAIDRDALVRPLFAANPQPMARRAAERSKRPSRPSIPRSTGSTAPRHHSRHLFGGCRCGAIFTDGGNTISGRLGFHSPACSASWPR